MSKLFGSAPSRDDEVDPEDFSLVSYRLGTDFVIMVNNRTGGVPVEVTGASVNDSAFKAEVVTIEKGKRYQVTITVNADASAGPRDSVLTVKTSDPEFPEITVPVRANIS